MHCKARKATENLKNVAGGGPRETAVTGAREARANLSRAGWSVLGIHLLVSQESP